MFPVQIAPRTGARQYHFTEAFFKTAAITIVASLSFNDLNNPDRVTEWRAYWHAFGEGIDHEHTADRVRMTSEYGSKIPEEMARSIFQRIDGPYNH